MNMNFSDEVKKILEQREMRYVDLARMTGYSAQYISDLIAGKRRWNEDAINKVCLALDIKILYENIEELKEEVK
ncbi:helix-turn-helix domain-containing protein [Virgibacillus pantothenticus]|nr:helix-turn-helix transcriptional regulator [Virgibacillus pantothenticus]MED3735885.1 helix-turn-helix transcriptional regulator [Virgibacillus pantothenticus]SIT15087.1 Cro/C1-type HTH DNA-binding domain-containing protein [Virgibacillus pantothenticus]